MEKENKPWYVRTNFPPYYGKFPYIVMRVSSGIYMQLPVHMIPKGIKEDPGTKPGAHLPDVPWEAFKLTLEERILHQHERLIELTQWCKAKLEADRKKFFQWCLVEAEDRCYYFDGEEVRESDQIPTGGTLLTQRNEVIAMMSSHFKEN